MRRPILLAVLLSGCDAAPELTEAPPPMPEAEKVDVVREALALYPRTLELHAGVIQRTCSPNPGVCHRTNNYPDLHSAGSLLALVNADCNLELPDPARGWDACERKADRLVTDTLITDLAYVEHLGLGRWKLHLREAPLQTARLPVTLMSASGENTLATPSEWDVGVALVGGSQEAELTVGTTEPYIADYVDSLVINTVPGDPNKNGVFGGDIQPHGALVTPGKLEQSYLWGRLTGTVPGTRMPLANQPLSNAEYVALACWIEGLAGRESPGVEDPIDYQHCAFAQAPIAYAR